MKNFFEHIVIYALLIGATIAVYSTFSEEKRSLPIFSKKNYNSKGIKSAAGDIAFREQNGKGISFQAPEVAILFYSPGHFKAIKTTYKTTQCDGYLAENLLFLDATNNKVGLVGNLGCFAPPTVYIVEKLISYGVKKIITLGACGSLNPSLPAGSVIICNRALRDEGISHHYLPPKKDIKASENMVYLQQKILTKADIDHTTGASWTMGALYRQTPEEVIQYQKQNIITVDGEAAALFAVGQFRNIPIGVFLVTGDTLHADGRWEGTIQGSQNTRESKEKLTRAIIEHFISLYKEDEKHD